MRTRTIQNADFAAIAALLQRGVVFDVGDRQMERVFELEGQIVGASAAAAIRIERPEYVPEPVPEIDAAHRPGDELALVGAGLVVARDVDVDTATMIHRIARTLRSEELGARWCVVVVPVPELPGFDPAGAVQQISAGAVDYAPIAIPLRDGYWPIGIVDDDHVVMVRRNDPF